MPSCSKAKNPSGHEIIFTEEDHSYKSVINNTEINYISGTSFLSKYYPPFDPTGEITKRCAAKEGISVEEIQAKWKAKGARSCRLGTRMHEVIEDTLLQRQVRNTAEDDDEQSRFNLATKVAQNLLQRADIIGVEKIVFSPQLGIAGTIDCLAQSKKNGEYLILDHKSNEKIETFNVFKKFCLAPISHIPAISLHEYSLQLSLYQYILKFEGYIPKGANVKMFLNHITPAKQQWHECIDYTNEIKDLMIDYLSKKTCV